MFAKLFYEKLHYFLIASVAVFLVSLIIAAIIVDQRSLVQAESEAILAPVQANLDESIDSSVALPAPPICRPETEMLHWSGMEWQCLRNPGIEEPVLEFLGFKIFR